MPKAVKSEGDCPRYFSHHVHYFPAAPVSPNKQPNRSRWPQEHKGPSFFFLYQQFTHEGEQSVYQAFKTRTELTDVWEKNTTCEREAVKSRRLHIHQPQQPHFSAWDAAAE